MSNNIAYNIFILELDNSHFIILSIVELIEYLTLRL